MLKAVRLTRPWGGKKAGEVAEFDPVRAGWLLANGYAEDPAAAPGTPKKKGKGARKEADGD